MSEELKALKKQLLKDDRNGYDVLSAAELAKMEAYCTVYKAFLDAGKTERLSAAPPSHWRRSTASWPTSGAWRCPPATRSIPATGARA